MRLDLARRVDASRIDFGPVVGRQPAARHHERGAAQVADRLHRFAGCHAMRQFDQRALGIAEQQDVRFRIHQHRTLHGIGPVIVMCNAAQTGFDAADYDRNARKRFARPLRIHHHCTIRPLVRFAVRRVRIV